MSIVYLACPYSHPDPEVRHARFLAANRAAARLMAEGLVVFSPLSHGHAIAQTDVGLPTDYEFWRKSCHAFMRACSSVTVLMLPGWEESVGIADELKIAEALDLPVAHLAEDY